MRFVPSVPIVSPAYGDAYVFGFNGLFALVPSVPTFWESAPIEEKISNIENGSHLHSRGASFSQTFARVFKNNRLGWDMQM